MTGPRLFPDYAAVPTSTERAAARSLVASWQHRLDLGATPCTCATLHRGDCSNPLPMPGECPGQMELL